MRLKLQNSSIIQTSVIQRTDYPDYCSIRVYHNIMIVLLEYGSPAMYTVIRDAAILSE